MSLTIEKLNEDLALLKSRQVEALQNFHQITGAISVLEQLLQRHKEGQIEQACDDEVNNVIDELNMAVMDNSTPQSVE